MPREKKVSEDLSYRQALELISAVKFGSWQSYRFTRFISINLEAGGVVPDDRLKAIQKFIKCMQSAAQYRKLVFAAVWVRERGEDVGEHVHIMAHIPDAYDGLYKSKYKAWLKLAGIQLVRGVINSKTIRCSGPIDQSIEQNLRANIDNIKNYMLKGTSRETKHKLNLPKEAYTGLIVGKRCGCTHNLGPKARKRQEFSE